MDVNPTIIEMTTKDILTSFSPQKSNLLNILHAVQNNSSQNYLSEEDLKEIAKHLKTTFSSVYGVATYYTMFSLKPRGKYIVRICHSPVCRMIGSIDIINAIRDELQILPGEVTKDKLFSYETSECLGMCDEAPVMMINDKAFGNLTPSKVKEIIANYKSSKP